MTRASSSSPPPCRTPTAPFHIGHIMEYIQADIWVRFQRMQGNEVHFVCADDAHGAPIMLAAEKAGQDAAGVRRRDRAPARQQYLDGFHIGFDNWHSTDSPENVELSQEIYRALKRQRADRRRARSSSSSTRSRACSCPTATSRATCPKCGAKDQYGDACEVCGSTYAPTDLINPYSALTGARPELRKSPSTSSSSCPTRAASSSCASGRLETIARRADAAARGARQGAGMARRRTAKDWPTGTSRATRPTSASRFPTRRASTSTSGSTRRSATSPR